MKINKYFKLFESRSSILSDDEFFKIMKENCQDFIKNPKPLQRVKDGYDTFSYINPKIHSRSDGSSASIAKNINIFLNNLPSWREFPKRNNSVIISSNMDRYEASYGSEYHVVIPFDVAKFGVTPSLDLWDVIIKLPSKNESIQDLKFTLSSLQRGLRALNIKNISYNEFISDIQSIFDHYKIEDDIIGTFSTKDIKTLFDWFISNDIENVEDGFDIVLSPTALSSHRKIGFVINSYSELETNYPYEIWTESECLLYNLGTHYECDACGNAGQYECMECEGSAILEDEEGNEVECDNCNDGFIECEECGGSNSLDKENAYYQFLEKIKKYNE